jgi:hypothetical protein
LNSDTWNSTSGYPDFAEVGIWSNRYIADIGEGAVIEGRQVRVDALANPAADGLPTSAKSAYWPGPSFADVTVTRGEVRSASLIAFDHKLFSVVIHLVAILSNVVETGATRVRRQGKERRVRGPAYRP